MHFFHRQGMADKHTGQMVQVPLLIHGPLSFAHEAVSQGATDSEGIAHDDAHATWIDLAYSDFPAANMTTDEFMHGVTAAQSTCLLYTSPSPRDRG